MFPYDFILILKSFGGKRGDTKHPYTVFGVFTFVPRPRGSARARPRALAHYGGGRGGFSLVVVLVRASTAVSTRVAPIGPTGRQRLLSERRCVARWGAAAAVSTP